MWSRVAKKTKLLLGWENHQTLCNIWGKQDDFEISKWTWSLVRATEWEAGLSVRGGEFGWRREKWREGKRSPWRCGMWKLVQIELNDDAWGISNFLSPYDQELTFGRLHFCILSSWVTSSLNRGMKQRSQFLYHICAASSEGMEKESAADQNGKDKLERSETKTAMGGQVRGKDSRLLCLWIPAALTLQSRAVWDVGLSEWGKHLGQCIIQRRGLPHVCSCCTSHGKWC